MDINQAKLELEFKKEQVEKLRDYRNQYFWIFIIIPAIIGLPIMIIGLIALGVWSLDALGFTFTFVGFSFILFSGIFAILFNKKRAKRRIMINALNEEIKNLEDEIEEERSREIKEIVEKVKTNLLELDELLAKKKINNEEYNSKKIALLALLEDIN